MVDVSAIAGALTALKGAKDVAQSMITLAYRASRYLLDEGSCRSDHRHRIFDMRKVRKAGEGV